MKNKMMQRAINISKNGGRKVFPNPMVGAVIFDDNGNIHSEGWHKIFGGDHAEIVALKNLKTKAEGLSGHIFECFDYYLFFKKLGMNVKILFRDEVSKEKILEKIAKIHFDFVKIHPFVDRN